MTGAGTVLLLHGVGLSGEIWRPVRELLEAGSRVLSPDLPGHGTAPDVPEGCTLADLADLVAADVAAEVTGPVHVVGFSLGALVGQHLAVHRPELVSSLASVSSVCRRTPTERAAVLARLEAASEDFPASVRASLHRWYDGTDVDARIVDETERILMANRVPSYLRCYRVFATADADLGHELGRIAVPALAITGSDDPGSTPDMTRRLSEAIPGCEAVVLPDTRHMLPVQRPTELAAALTELMQRQN